MDKLSNYVNQGIKKESFGGFDSKIDNPSGGFGEIFADTITKDSLPDASKGQSVSSDDGRDLPEDKDQTQKDREIKTTESMSDKKSKAGNDFEKGETDNVSEIVISGENKQVEGDLENIAIGESINIITTADGLVDDDSLVAYAKKEGMSSSSISLLLNPENSKPIQISLAKDSGNSSKFFGAGGIKISDDGKNTGNELALVESESGLKSDKTVNYGYVNKLIPEVTKMDQDSKRVAESGKIVQAAVSLKVKTDGKTSILKSNRGDLSGKVISIETVSIEMKDEFLGFLEKLKHEGFNSKLPVTVTGESSVKVDENPFVTLNGKTDGLISNESDLVRVEESLKRTDQFQLLAQRMSDAIGHRLKAQIVKGAWQVQIALRPEQMGKIDIQLGLNNGEIEAVFKSVNPLTRELIVEGFPRLRDILEETGMEVATLLLDGRESGTNDEKPTDGQGEGKKAERKGDGTVGDNGTISTESTVSDENVDILV